MQYEQGQSYRGHDSMREEDWANPFYYKSSWI
jgi:hypothetical protein